MTCTQVCNCIRRFVAVVADLLLRYRRCMGNYRRGPPGVQFSLPPLSPWLRNLLIGLLVLFVVEMVLVNGLGIPIYPWLAWSPGLAMDVQGLPPLDPEAVTYGRLVAPGGGPGLADLWQPFTQLLVQGPNIGALLMVGLVAYFFLPHVVDRYTPRQLWQAGAAAVLGVIPAGWLWVLICYGLVQVGFTRAATWLVQPGMGLAPLAFGAMILFGLGQPDAQVNIMFVLPIKARTIVWIVLGFVALAFLVSPGVHSFQYFGTVGAVVAWYQWMGPGASRRRYRRAGQSIERQLNLRVYDGGKQGGQGRGDPDEWIN